MGRFGCYCGFRSRSNKIRWVCVLLFFLGGLIGFCMAIAELAQCNDPCDGDAPNPKLKTRRRGMTIYFCSDSTMQHGARTQYAEPDSQQRGRRSA